MDVALILLILCVVVVGYIVLRFVHKILEIVVLVFVLAVIGGALCGYMIYADVADVTQHANETYLFVVVNNGVVTQAFSTVGFTLAQARPLTPSELQAMQVQYSQTQFDAMRGSNYRMLIIDQGVVPLKDINTSITRTLQATASASLKTGGIRVYPETRLYALVRFMHGLFRRS